MSSLFSISRRAEVARKLEEMRVLLDSDLPPGEQITLGVMFQRIESLCGELIDEYEQTIESSGALLSAARHTNFVDKAEIQCLRQQVYDTKFLLILNSYDLTPKPRFSIYWEPRDLYIGLFRDPEKRRLYFVFLGFVFRIQLK